MTAPRTAPRLVALLDRLSADGQPAPASMRRLNRILGCAELRRGAAMLHFPVQAFTLWDFHVLFALERWRVSSGRRVRGWLEALGELEALNAARNRQTRQPGMGRTRVRVRPRSRRR